MAPAAEHLLSLLSSSYNCTGGLNSKDGGDAALISTAIRQELGIWSAAATAIQDNYIRSSRGMLHQVVVNTILTRWPKNKDEIRTQEVDQFMTDQVRGSMHDVADDTLHKLFEAARTKALKLETLAADVGNMIEVIELQALAMALDSLEEETHHEGA